MANYGEPGSGTGDDWMGNVEFGDSPLDGFLNGQVPEDKGSGPGWMNDTGNLGGGQSQPAPALPGGKDTSGWQVPNIGGGGGEHAPGDEGISGGAEGGLGLPPVMSTPRKPSTPDIMAGKTTISGSAPGMFTSQPSGFQAPPKPKSIGLGMPGGASALLGRGGGSPTPGGGMNSLSSLMSLLKQRKGLF